MIAELFNPWRGSEAQDNYVTEHLQDKLQGEAKRFNINYAWHEELLATIKANDITLQQPVVTERFIIYCGVKPWNGALGVIACPTERYKPICMMEA